MRRVVIVGTGTEVGKTWVGAHLIAAARAAGVAVSVRKPIQSFDAVDELTDADLLAIASGETPHQVCPARYWFSVPMAPPMAAAVLGRPAPTIDELIDSIVWPETADLVLIETVGGLRSPIASDGDSRDLLNRLRSSAVILVGDAGLGTINDCLLAAEAMAPHEPVIVLNHFDASSDLHQRNLRWLLGCGLTTIPVDPAVAWSATLLQAIGE